MIRRVVCNKLGAWACGGRRGLGLKDSSELGGWKELFGDPVSFDGDKLF